MEQEGVDALLVYGSGRYASDIYWLSDWPSSREAYLLVQALRRTALAGTELACAQVGTIRLKLLNVAARVAVSVRRVVFHLTGSYPYRGIFERAYRRLMGVVVAAADSG